MNVYLVETRGRDLAPGRLRRAVVVAADEVGAIQAVVRLFAGRNVFSGPGDVGRYVRRDVAGLACPLDEDHCVVTGVGTADSGPARVLSTELVPEVH